jgi:hypothetical protein
MNLVEAVSNSITYLPVGTDAVPLVQPSTVSKDTTVVISDRLVFVLIRWRVSLRCVDKKKDTVINQF